MGRSILTLLLLIVTLAPCSAITDIYGKVESNHGESIISATIRILDSSDIIIAFAITDIEGKYQIELPDERKDTLKVSVSYLGYETVNMLIDGDNCKLPLDFELKEQEFELEEVVVKAPEMATLGDTILYNVDSFVNDADRSIEDVIKKLPGIQVEDGGRIYYNGEAINKFYIEGLDLLGGRYAIATKNISPEDIATISVYENHQPKQVLKDIRLSEKAALNLSLKDKRGIKPIGYVKGGGGYGASPEWLAELFGMHIASTRQTIVTGKGNNAGLSYSNETKSFWEDTSTGTIAYDIFPQTPFGTASIPVSRYYLNQSYASSFNVLFKLKEHLTLNASVDYTHEANNYSNTVTTDYQGIGDSPMRIIETNQSALNSHVANARIKIENNSPLSYLNNELKFKGRFNDNAYHISKGATIHQSLSNDDYNLSNCLNIIARTKKNVYEFNSLVSVANTPDNFISATIPSADSLLVYQTAQGFSFYTLEDATFSWLVSMRADVGMKISFEAFYDLFKSSQSMPNLFINNINDNFGYKIVSSAEPYCQLKFGNTTWRTELPIRMYNICFTDGIGDLGHTFHRPYVDFKSSLNFYLFSHVRTSIALGRKHTIGGLEDFIVNPISTTYRQSSVLGAGILNLRKNDYLTVNASYRNTVEGLFWALRASYNNLYNNTMTASEITSEEFTTEKKQRETKGTTADLYFTFSKKLKDLNTTFTLTGNAMLMKRTTQRQGNVMDVRNDVYTLKGDASSNFFDNKLSTNFSCHYIHTRQSSIMFTPTRLNDIILNMELSYFPFRRFELFYDLYFSQTELAANTTPQNCFMDAGVRYTYKDVDIELSGRNLTNKRTYSYSKITAYDLYTYQFNLRPIEFLVSLRFGF